KASHVPNAASNNSGGVMPSSRPPFDTGWSQVILCPRASASNLAPLRCLIWTSIQSSRCIPLVEVTELHLNSCLRSAKCSSEAVPNPFLPPGRRRRRTCLICRVLPPACGSVIHTDTRKLDHKQNMQWQSDGRK